MVTQPNTILNNFCAITKENKCGETRFPSRHSHMLLTIFSMSMSSCSSVLLSGTGGFTSATGVSNSSKPSGGFSCKSFSFNCSKVFLKDSAVDKEVRLLLFLDTRFSVLLLSISLIHSSIWKLLSQINVSVHFARRIQE